MIEPENQFKDITRVVHLNKEEYWMIRMIKVEHLMEIPHPNGIDNGKVIEGIVHAMPTIGERFNVQRLPITFSNAFSTSPVTAIINETTFRTLNSVYTFEILKQDTSDESGNCEMCGEKLVPELKHECR